MSGLSHLVSIFVEDELVELKTRCDDRRAVWKFSKFTPQFATTKYLYFGGTGISL